MHAECMHALDPSLIEQKYNKLSPLLTEMGRRIWAATEADALGYGGITTVARATGLSRTTIKVGLKELVEGFNEKAEQTSFGSRIRRSGGGRKTITEKDPRVIDDLELIGAFAEGSRRIRNFMLNIHWTLPDSVLLYATSRGQHYLKALAVRACVGRPALQKRRL